MNRNVETAPTAVHGVTAPAANDPRHRGTQQTSATTTLLMTGTRPLRAAEYATEVTSATAMTASHHGPPAAAAPRDRSPKPPSAIQAAVIETRPDGSGRHAFSRR